MTRRRIRAFLASVLFAAICVVAGAPSPALADTDCNQSSGLGDRICLDATTGYGPVVYVYTSATQTYSIFPVVIAPQCWGVASFYTTDPYWNAYGANGIVSGATLAGGGNTNLFVGNFTYAPGGCSAASGRIAKTTNQTNINTLLWFAGGCCPSMEFVSAE